LPSQLKIISKKNQMDKLEYLKTNIFNGLENLNDGFDSENIYYFSESDFEIVLDRVEKYELSIYGIEPWINGTYYDVLGFEDFNARPTDPTWYRKAFSEFKKSGKELMYAASYGIPKTNYTLLKKKTMKSKKEMKATYLQMKPEMGVFEIKNNVDGKILIDKSTNIKSKMNRHKTELKFNSHKNKELQKDWNEHGEDNFSMNILSKLEYSDDESINYKEELKLLESLIKDELDTNIKQY